MVVTSHQVVSPPKDQGSVLAQVVARQSVLGQLLYWIAFCNANARLLASVQAELAALRAQKYPDYVAELHHVSEFVEPPAPISRKDEPLFSKPRHLRLVAQCQAKIAARFVVGVLEDGPREHAIGFASFFVRQNRAFEKGMRGFSENDLLIIARCFLKELRAHTETALRKVRAESRKIDYCSWGFFSRFDLTAHHQKLTKETARDGVRKAEKRCKQLSVVEYYDRLAENLGLPANWREVNVAVRLAAPVVKRYGCWTIAEIAQNEHPITPYDVRWDALLRKKALAERLASNVNWCPTCQQYVKWSHDGPGGINCEDRLATIAEKRAVRPTKQSKKKNGATHRVSEKHLQPRGRGATDINRHEDIMARRADAAFKRWLTESKMVEQRHPNAPPRVRSLEKIVSESRYFPI